MKIEDIINSLTLEEKASILCGDAIMETKAIPEKGVAPLIMSDGPNGVRRISDSSGFNLNDPIPATSFPTGSTTAQSWDKSLLYEIGEGIAKECQYFGIQTILGPAFNIKRNPLCGRNFEYFSEDPLLSGYLASSYVKGVQDNHVFATIKHYACNNNERWRYTGDSIVDERALREIYLKPFEITIRESNPKAIMTSSNKINGEHASQNYHIHKEILRDEWKYDGLSMSDWGGMDDRLISLINGQDLEMPGCIEQNVQKIIDGYNNGKISMDIIDKSIYRILKLVEEGQNLPKRVDYVFEENKELSIKAAKESMVLLKNKYNTLLNRYNNLSASNKTKFDSNYFNNPLKAWEFSL